MGSVAEIDARSLEGKGVGIAKAHSFEEEESSMVHEQLARLNFARDMIDMNGKSILDFGCGTGYNSFYISENNERSIVTAIDILPECIEYCENYYKNDRIRFQVGDCLEYDPSLGRFDVVVCSEVIEHVEDQRSMLENAARYTRESGHIFLSTPNKGLFSLSKDKSFLNHTHVRELFYDEFSEIVDRHLQDYRIFSQVHAGEWHDVYMDYVSVANIVHSLKTRILADGLASRILAKLIGRLLYALLFRNRANGYRDVRERRHSDFTFVEGFDNRAMWFVAIGRPKAG